MPKLSKAYVFSASSFLFMYISWALWWSFFQIWLTNETQGLGLNGANVGTIFAVNGFATIIMMLLYGVIQDALGMKRHLLYVIAVLASLMGPFAVFVYRPLLETNFTAGLLVGAVYLPVAFSAAVAFFEAYFNRVAQHFAFEFGRVRMFGSLGFSIAVFISGMLFPLDANLIFWAASGAGLALLAILCFAPQDFKTASRVPVVDTVAVETVSKVPTKVLLRDSKLWILAVFVVLVWNMFSIFDAQMFPDFFAGLFTQVTVGQRSYGTLIAIQTFSETLLMSLLPMLINRIGVKQAIVLGATLFLIVCGVPAFTLSIPLIVAAKLVHSAFVPLMILGIMRYVDLHFDRRRSATIYLLGFYVTAQVASMLLSTPLGMLRDMAGYQTVFQVMFGSCLVGIAFGSWKLLPDRDGAKNLH